jgi:hypothetical protein
MHPTPLERVQRSFNECVIHADGSNFNLQFLDPKLLFYFLLDGVPGLGAQTTNALVGVIARKSSQIHAGNCPQKPRCLPFLFYGSSRDMGLNAALDCAGVDSHFSDPIQVERNAGIREQRLSGERSNRTAAVCSVWWEIPKLIVIDRH